MTDRPPPPFDDGRSRRRLASDDVTPPRGSRRSDSPDDQWDDEWDEDWDEPNYLVRRALIVAGVVILIAVAAIIASRFIGGDDEAEGNSNEAAEWNTIVAIDEDDIRIIDRESGDEIATYDSSEFLRDSATLVAGDVLISPNDDGRVTLIDISDGTDEVIRVADDARVSMSFFNPTIAIAGSEAGGDVSIIRTEERDSIDVNDVAELEDAPVFPLSVRVNASGSHAAVPVPTLFQSVIIDLDEQTSEAIAGRVIAISDEFVVAEQPAGDESEIEFYDLVGERLGSVDVPSPVAGLLRPDGTLLMVDETGTIRTATADEEVDEVGTLSDPNDANLDIANAVPVANGERLVVFGTSQAFVLDTNGEQLAVVDGRRQTAAVTYASECVVLEGRPGADETALVDLDDGAVLQVAPDGIISSSSVDGCTATVLGQPKLLVLSRDDVLDVPGTSIGTVAPDGSSFVVVDRRDTELIDLETGDRTELSDGEPVVVRFGQR